MKNLLVFPVTYHFTNCKVLSDLIPFIVSFPLFFFSILKRKLILFEVCLPEQVYLSYGMSVAKLQNGNI